MELDGFFLRVRVAVGNIDGNGLTVVVGVGVLNAECVDLFLADEVDCIVGGNAEKPGAESEILFETVKGAERLIRELSAKVYE